jgi:hypothetical protein
LRIANCGIGKCEFGISEALHPLATFLILRVVFGMFFAPQGL